MTKRQHTIRLNYLKRVQIVQEIYQRHKQEGVSDAFIWRKHVYPVMPIGQDSFYRYLQISPQKELKSIGAQLALFQ